MLFYLSISNIDKGIVCTPSKFASDIKWSGAVDSSDGQYFFQRDLNKVGKWAHGNIMRFKKYRGKVLHLGWDNPQYQLRLGMKRWRAALGTRI